MSEGYSCQWIRRAVDMPQPFEQEAFDCVLLDLALPDGSGLGLLAKWRNDAIKAPVIIMTGRSALEDRLIGLDGGADDYLVKPFAPAELLSRIRAVVRRSALQASEVWTLGELYISSFQQLVRRGEEIIELSPREFALLLELARRAGTVVAKKILAQRLQPLGDPIAFSALEVHVFNLRSKIGPDRIRTVRGIGYMLVP
jgi:two-component system, OmpR family, response regulator QseB